jgi:AbrB family looped-hinge helix DNA binding protein
MTTVTVSPKYQVVIPKEIRQKLKLKPGQKLQILQLEDRIEFLILKNIKETRGFLKGINTEIEREGDRL